ncbi:hypothetical protein NDU88_010296 [Pleurodeles waltl]|uniref:Uncharacterized protein n=1 Tax=Pleurodeles waltl TaxID=8319 RepID=A0AAV7RYK8_PLEWA|nr:hypothetical protein NDU88_010296 [Pleurodeles waltl]
MIDESKRSPCDGELDPVNKAVEPGPITQRRASRRRVERTKVEVRSREDEADDRREDADREQKEDADNQEVETTGE